VTTKLSPYVEFEYVARLASRAGPDARASGGVDAARKVSLGQDFPLAPPPPVQFVLCFEEGALSKPADDPTRCAYVGFREENGHVRLLPATPQEVINGLRNLQATLRKYLGTGR
jgi:hypothetical protein